MPTDLVAECPELRSIDIAPEQWDAMSPEQQAAAEARADVYVIEQYAICRRRHNALVREDIVLRSEP